MNDTSQKVEWKPVWSNEPDADQKAIVAGVELCVDKSAFGGKWWANISIEEGIVGTADGFPDLPSAQAAAIAKARSIARQILHDTGGDEVLEALKQAERALFTGDESHWSEALNSARAAISSAEAGIKR